MGTRQASTKLFADATQRRERPRRRKRSDGGAGETQTSLVGRLAGWVPLLLALGLFVHLCLGGLRPALQEKSRLERVAQELLERRGGLVSEAQALEQLRGAQSDPVYLERMRRRSLDPQFGPDLGPPVEPQLDSSQR